MSADERGLTPAELLEMHLTTTINVQCATTRSRVIHIAENISYSKQLHTTPSRFLEMDIVQDADRLEALGAVGVARAFACGGAAGRSLADTRAHYEEKLVRLVPLMRTAPGAAVAHARAERMRHFMEAYDDELRWADAE